jgi:hypothetical protein
MSRRKTWHHLWMTPYPYITTHGGKYLPVFAQNFWWGSPILNPLSPAFRCSGNHWKLVFLMVSLPGLYNRQRYWPEILYGVSTWKTRGHHVTLPSRDRSQIPSIIEKKCINFWWNCLEILVQVLSRHPQQHINHLLKSKQGQDESLINNVYFNLAQIGLFHQKFQIFWAKIGRYATP